MEDMRALAYRTQTVIDRSPEEVFEFCSDLRSELRWNTKARYVEKLTDGSVGVGTRHRARWANSGHTTVEVVVFDRPRSWETIARARGMGIRFQGTVTNAGPGRATSPTWSFIPGAWLGWWRLLLCWLCDATTSSTCAASSRRLSRAR